ncbi:SMI1/KNR4 family protein [Paenibacillus sp. JJ-223]|uniref:SMI1/KNR4 family protein n=1 Tax=Paenibacillus sp. JJ-223 TaxID=2905647 RepID=UPI001F295388|nr:SMI1/KNR4 family protein [Paenibacillus sp. JJ-223]CAH1222024.1 hypothetical protein PAECIP111890_05336 [Paenibacillus sp. JJ-223]
MKAAFDVLNRVLEGHVGADDFISEQDLCEQEQRLGIRFPDVLREYYKRFGNCRYITQHCNNQYEPMRLQETFVPGPDFFTTDKAFLVFYQCEESVIYCGIRLSDVSMEDPPVYLCAWNNPDWSRENESLSNFLVSKALVQMAVEDRLPFWVIFDENMWRLSDYLSCWEMEGDACEIKETSSVQAWRIFYRNHVIVLFEMSLGDDDEELLAVYLASFDRENIARMVDTTGRAQTLPEYRSNIVV